MVLCSVGCNYTKLDRQDCLYNQNLHHLTSDQASGYENCKEWCADNTDCGGFTGSGDNCYFKRLACKDNVFAQSHTHLYLKELV